MKDILLIILICAIVILLSLIYLIYTIYDRLKFAKDVYEKANEERAIEKRKRDKELRYENERNLYKMVGFTPLQASVLVLMSRRLDDEKLDYLINKVKMRKEVLEKMENEDEDD